MVVGVVEVDRIAVGKHELDPTEGVFVAGELDETVGDRSAVFGAGEFGEIERYLFASLKDMDIVRFEVARIGAEDGDEIAADEVVGDCPGGIEHHVFDPIAEDRCGAVDASDDEGAGKGSFATPDVAEPVVGDIDFGIFGFEMAGVELEDIEIGDDLFEVEALGFVEVEDHLVVDIVPAGEIEACFETANRCGEAAAPASTGAVAWKIAEEMEALFDGADPIVHAVGFEEFAVGDFFPLGHGSVFAQNGNELLVAVGQGDLCGEERIDLPARESRIDALGGGHSPRMELPRGSDILCRFEACHFALDQSPVDIPDSDKTEQAQKRIGQGDIELFFDP